MTRWERFITAVGGEKVLVALGGLFVVVATGRAILMAVDEVTLTAAILEFLLTGGPWLLVLYGGYRLPKTELDPGVYSRIAAWSLGGFGLMLVVLGLVQITSTQGLDRPVFSGLLATGLGSAGGLGIGVNVARALSRAREAERHRDELHQERDLRERIVQTSPIGIGIVDTDGTVRMVNEHAAQIIGLSRDELTEGKSYNDSTFQAMDADGNLIEGGMFEEILTTGKATYDVERQITDADGERVWLTVNGAPLRDPSGNVTAVIFAFKNITERKEREAELELFRNLIDHSNESVFVIDPDTGTFLDVNEMACCRLGYDRTALLELTVSDIETSMPDREAWQAHVEDVRGEGTVTFEGEHQRADGTTLPVEVNVSHVALDREYMLAVARDVTERREHEQKLEESNDRLEQFAYAASHDLQEPLRMVSSYLQLIERRYADDLDEDGREFLEFAVDGADRMSDMIEGLLEYSRVDTQGESFERIELEEIVEDVLEDLQFQIEESDAEVTVESLRCVEGDASQVRQVFQNLVSNAIEYSGDDPPRIHISAEPDGERRVISISDEGIGIDPADTERIFEVFQRLHNQEEHAGTGIGLALCRRVVERHEGDIWVESDPGEGTTFHFTLPLADEE
jgi:PAS domain S-box-containing protein